MPRISLSKACLIVGLLAACDERAELRAGSYGAAIAEYDLTLPRLRQLAVVISALADSVEHDSTFTKDLNYETDSLVSFHLGVIRADSLLMRLLARAELTPEQFLPLLGAYSSGAIYASLSDSLANAPSFVALMSKHGRFVEAHRDELRSLRLLLDE